FDRAVMAIVPDDDQGQRLIDGPGLNQQWEGPQQSLRTFEPLQPPGEHDHPGSLEAEPGAQPVGTPRAEDGQVNPGGHHADTGSRCPIQALEVRGLLQTGCDQAVAIADDSLLDCDPMVWFEHRTTGGPLVFGS